MHFSAVMHAVHLALIVQCSHLTFSYRIAYSFKIRLSYRNPNNVALKKCELNNEILYATYIYKFK